MKRKKCQRNYCSCVHALLPLSISTFFIRDYTPKLICITCIVIMYTVWHTCSWLVVLDMRYIRIFPRPVSFFNGNAILFCWSGWNFFLQVNIEIQRRTSNNPMIFQTIRVLHRICFSFIGEKQICLRYGKLNKNLLFKYALMRSSKSCMIKPFVISEVLKRVQLLFLVEGFFFSWLSICIVGRMSLSKYKIHIHWNSCV